MTDDDFTDSMKVEAGVCIILFLLAVIFLSGCSSSTRATEQVQTEKWDKVTVSGTFQIPQPEGPPLAVPVALTIDRTGGETREKTSESKTTVDGEAIGRAVAAALTPVLMAGKNAAMPWTSILSGASTAVVAATTGYLALAKRKQMTPERRPPGAA